MKTISTRITLKIGGRPQQLYISVPNRKTKAEVLLPFFRSVTQKAEDIAINEARQKGNTVSCSKGCDACCSQLIAITPIEAAYLTKLISRMSKARQKQIKDRFRDIQEQLESAGLRQQVMNITENTDLVSIGLKYFELKLPCPFLQDRCCSIYAERPLVCREYLVSNPAQNCQTPSKHSVQILEFPVKMSRVLSELDYQWSGLPERVVPLSQLTIWLETNSHSIPPRHSKDWVEDALKTLSKS